MTIYVPSIEEKIIMDRAIHRIIDVLSPFDTEQKAMMLFSLAAGLENMTGIRFSESFESFKKIGKAQDTNRERGGR